MKALVILLSSTMAFAIPLPKQSVPYFFPETFTADYDFTGIVGLNNCSGSLVKLEKSSDDDLALAFTNGHCYEGGFLQAGQVILDKSTTRRLTIYGETTAITHTVNAERIVYATMTKTDVALYRLGVTYRQIRERAGIEALTLANNKPSSTLPIEIISGYWKRGYRCNIDGFAYRIKEGDWTWEDSIRYSKTGCDTIGGTSGSPILEAGTRKMIGINNTGNEDGQRCTLNNPCEVDEAGNVTFRKGQNYGQQTYWVYSCLDANNQFDASIEGCQLPN